MEIQQLSLLNLKEESQQLPDKDSADIEIAFPLVNFAIGTGGDKDAKIMVNALTRETWSPFNGCENWQPFIFCATYGYAKKKSRIPPPGSGTMPASAFKTETRDLMRAIAIADTDDLRIIKKASGKEGYVKISEEYAYSALKEVHDRLKTRDDGEEVSPEAVIEKMIHEVEDARKKENQFKCFLIQS